MAMESEDGGGFGWGMVVGAVVGFVAGALLASGPGREQVDSLRMRTIELTGRSDELKARARQAAERARGAVQDPGHPVGRAIQDGITAAKRRRQELEMEANTTELNPPAGPGAAEGL
jgi:gas vesicle protein